MRILTSADTVVIARYCDLERARQAVDELRRLGVPQKELSVVSSGDYYPEKDFRIIDGAYLDDTDSSLEKGAEAGAVAGAAGGALLGLGAVVLPGVGALWVAGAVLLGAITGMSTGALAGGTIGVLMELGFSKNQAEDMSTGLDEGHVIVMVEDTSVPKDQLHEALTAHRPEALLVKDVAHSEKHPVDEGHIEIDQL